MSELVEKVARVLDPAAWRLIDDNLDRPEGTALHKAGVRYRDMSLTKARAAIAAVAEWLAQSEDRECNPLQAIAAALRAAAGGGEK